MGKYFDSFDGQTRDELLAGTEVPVLLSNASVKAGTEIERGQLLVDAGSGFVSLVGAGDASLTGASFFIAKEGYASVSLDGVTTVYDSGRFNREKIGVSDGVTLSAFEEPLRKENILLTSIQEKF